MQWREPCDADVVMASREDPEQFGEVFRRYHDTIFRYVARRLGTERAGDVTADVFVRAFRIRDRYDPSHRSCRPWLYGIATNVIGDALRSMRRAGSLLLTMRVDDVVVADETWRSDELVDAATLRPALNVALGRLADRDRDVLLLYALEQLTYGEVAEALSIPVGTVRSRLARARAQMHEHLTRHGQTTVWNDEPGRRTP